MHHFHIRQACCILNILPSSIPFHFPPNTESKNRKTTLKTWKFTNKNEAFLDFHVIQTLQKHGLHVFGHLVVKSQTTIRRLPLKSTTNSQIMHSIQKTPTKTQKEQKI